MTVYSLVLIAGLSATSGERVLDGFEYADAQAARAAWAASSPTPPVDVAKEDNRTVLKFDALFATNPNQERTIIDRGVELDLADVGQFTLEIATDKPEAVGHLSLYFHSGNGWYAAGKGLTKKGWQTLHFSKASFKIEEQPAGWHKIDTIRISAWRGQAVDAQVRIRRLAALWHDVALVIPAAYAHQEDRELKAALDTADRVAGMLHELGLGADAIEDAALVQGALGNRRVAVLSYNPRLGTEAIAALGRFVEGGGKLLLCYQLPTRLGKLLGFDRAKYVPRERPGQFSQIRFEATDIPGLPKAVKQASWNITTAEPVGHNARVIGRWFDAEGKPTGRAAMLLSDRGAFFTHIILTDDRAGKKQLLAAVLGKLHPPLWQQMAQSELDQADKVGHCDGLAQAAAHVKAAGNAKARQQLDTAVELLNAAKKEFAQAAYPRAIELARQAHDTLADAYVRGQPSPEREGRAIWNHSGTGAYDGDWERSARLLASNGFNMVLPNMLWAGRAHYPSDVLPRSATFEKFGDQIAQCLAAAKKHGLEVHVWKVNYNLSGAPKDFVERLRREGRTQVAADGQPHNWLCPSHPENLKLELESMLEVARKYDVDGLHFDYIRYPGGQYCYCDGCRKRFEAETGRQVANWPKDCYSGPRRKEYRDWRAKQITKLVEAVHREAKKLKPKIKISAAVFGAYPSCRESVGQDWPQWIKAGYLDFVCPMDYTQSDLSFINLVTNQLKLVEGRIPVYPGIGAWRLTPDRTVGQIHHARRLGAAGFTIFNFHESTADAHIPAIGLGAGSKRAMPLD